MSNNLDTSIRVKLIEDANTNNKTNCLDTIELKNNVKTNNISIETAETDSDNNIKIIQSSNRLRSKRWILALTCLCFILGAALVFCFIKYKLCCVNENISETSYVADHFKSNSNKKTCNNNSNNNNLFVFKQNSKNSLNYKHNAASPDESFEEEDESQQQQQSSIDYSYLDDEYKRPDWNNSRLPINFKPYFYNISLRINVYKKVFNGSCSIRFICLEPITFIVIHTDTNVLFENVNYKPKIYELASNSSNRYVRNLTVKEMSYNKFFSYYVIRLEKGDRFRKNKNYIIKFEQFYSNITNNLKGIYYSTYTSKNQNRTIVVSQLQPLEARKVFPGFDEPNLKAKFLISMEHHREFTALSNMDEVSKVKLDDQWMRTNFDVTPQMSTYILAFTVSDFKPIHTVGPNNLKVRVWARDDYVNNTQFALDIIPKAYQFFQDYFNISEVVKKSDHFAAPDFSAGAMENWGLVLYRESALLFDQEKSLLEDEYFVVLVICHEISHSWFGNMATFKWWDNVWLNEAFANILMYFAIDHIRPDFNVLETLVVHDIFNVMEKDSIETSHPVSTYVEDPTQVQQYFDEISYEKGFSVLRMLRGFIGDDLFRKSLQNHIRKYMFSNCDMNELWQVFSETVGHKYNISEIMTNWLTQEGYPVINVNRIVNETAGTVIYELKQKYFLLSESKPSNKNYKWVIPFTYKFKNNEKHKNIIWLNLTDNKIELPLTNENKQNWIYGNLDFMGYYRVNYDEQNWLKIIQQLKTDHKVFGSTERAALIYDAFTLARVGYLEYPIALELSSYLIKETDFVPWKSFFKSITYLDNMLSSSSCYGLFQEYCSIQINKIYHKLGWEDKGSFLERLLRAHVVKYASYFEIDDAVKKARTKFEMYMNGTKKPEKHLVEAVYCSGIRYGTYKNWINLFNMSKNSIPAEQNILWQALACNRDTWILKGLLETTLEENVIRKSDTRRIYTYYTLTSISRSVYFDFVTKNWEILLKNNGNDAFIMSSLLESLAVGTNDEYSLDRIKKMLEKGAGSASNSADYIIDQISTNIKWMNNYEKKICNYLKPMD